MDRSSYRYEPRDDRNAELRAKLVELARSKPRWGYRRLGVLLERAGEKVNPKRLFGLLMGSRSSHRWRKPSGSGPLGVVVAGEK